ncbi:hypothetical protein GCM10010234_48600 [Streptomyces hawaiiensis]
MRAAASRRVRLRKVVLRMGRGPDREGPAPEGVRGGSIGAGGSVGGRGSAGRG